ncbi:putative L-aspartate dehydrogenase [Strongylocentrotus purpuratus]|uniref:Aspartate dehydrogenase domain-containing protein n=1 Tax=Strongylocentrotus purpuratus TaxID=7668 RepID=A0A7M7P824_STRPU|nr:putative L-aspartate dehydrogenase [Strongylocentrotus purpuratus]
MATQRRIGIVGFGKIGKYLFENIKGRDDFEIVFVWNRSTSAMDGIVPPNLVLDDLSKFASRNADLIIEVAHPCISDQYGADFISSADYFVGSPTALADAHVEKKLRDGAIKHGLYIPSGALWGGQDIQKMADRGTLQGLKITMTKHPDAFRLESPLKEVNETVLEPTVLYDGPVKDLCPLAPNNVNTMAAACMMAHNLGFEKVQGCIASDPNAREYHLIQIDVIGPGDASAGKAFTVSTTRKSPASYKAVTSNATYVSFFSSVLRAQGQGAGVHLC